MAGRYVINELGSSVATYRFDPQRGSLQRIQILPSTPADYTSNNHGAEIAVAPSSRVVYASNRGHDSIGIFAVDQRSGTLRPLGWAPTHEPGRCPGATARFPTPTAGPAHPRAVRRGVLSPADPVREHRRAEAATAPVDPGCAKTRAFNLLVESSSQFG
jgi:hypothetical protein